MPRIDEFFYKQPPLKFVDKLRAPLHTAKPSGFGTREADADEYCAYGAYIDSHFPDEENLLETAYDDFKNFSEIYEVCGDKYPIVIEKVKTDVFESFAIVPKADKCIIEAGDTEGVRRAIIYIEDEFVRREGAFLPKEPIKKSPKIRSRITRGFFSPTNRPPKNGDELFDDIEYYPDEYLNRLAHDGTNGIWIYTSFRALMTSRYIPEYGEGGEKRIAKLREVVKKCKRYGVKVYVFAIEPMNLSASLAKAHPELLGANSWRNEVYPFCPNTEAGRNYILEATEKLFRLVPDLGGYMDITNGERYTSCVSSGGYNFHSCPRCSKLRRGEALAQVVNLIREGMRRAGTGAEFISWTYGHRLWNEDEIRDYVRNCDDDIMLMQNFDDMGYPEQLGKTRVAVDYWLSYVGPSPLFENTADEAKKTGKHMFAKMQVCCSHELATVPYIPVPGMIFDKYKGARKWGVEGVLQCWYFGNYPSIMSKAAGELSFMDMDDFADKDGFIERLAATYYGRSKAKKVSAAWKLFEAGYENYPVNIMFSYYGPIHDGVVWKLALKPKDYCLARTWMLLDPPDGDRIHESLWQGHTLDEAIILAERMMINWKEGMKLLDEVKDTELYTLSKSIELLFASGYNILNFYRLREYLGEGVGSPSDILEDMEKIVYAEMENSREMIDVCNADCRLGYHSEAEGFKFFPEKLEDRIESLKELLRTEFPEVRERMEKGVAPLEFYLGEKDGKPVENAYYMEKGDTSLAEWDKVGDTDAKVRLGYDEDNLYFDLCGKKGSEFHFLFEYKLLHPDTELIVCGEKVSLDMAAHSHQSVFGDKVEDTISKYDITTAYDGETVTHKVVVSRKNIDWKFDTPLRMRLEVFEPGWFEREEECKQNNQSVPKKLWQHADDLISLLGKNSTDPRAYKWILPKK